MKIIVTRHFEFDKNFISILPILIIALTDGSDLGFGVHWFGVAIGMEFTLKRKLIKKNE